MRPSPLRPQRYRDVPVKEKHKEEVESQFLEAGGWPICSDLDVPEDKVTGKTYLYVEKEIHIYIHKLPVLSF